MHKWADFIINSALLPFMEWLATRMLWQKRRKWLHRPANKIHALVDSPVFVNAMTMALRGAWYLPAFLAAGLLTDSRWFVLPAAFFWQGGAVYAVTWKANAGYVGGYTGWDNAIRWGLFMLALMLALQP